MKAQWRGGRFCLAAVTGGADLATGFGMGEVVLGRSLDRQEGVSGSKLIRQEISKIAFNC